MFDAIRARVGRIFSQRQVAPDRSSGLNYINIGAAIAGVRLNEPEDAMKIAAVYRCVSIVSEAIASLPWGVYGPTPDGAKTAQQRDHRVAWMLHHECNPEQTAFVAKRAMVAQMLLGGRMCAEIERDTIGRAVNLWPLHYSRVTPARAEDGRLVFDVRQGAGSSVMLEPRDIFYVPGLSLDGLNGHSVLDVARLSLSGAIAQDEFAANYIANGMHLSGVVKTPNTLGEDGRKSLLDFLAKFSGHRRAGKILPLDAGMEYQSIAATPEQSQFLDARRFSVHDVCRWFGVPPHLVYDLSHATFSNIESQSREFLTYGLLPRILPMEQEANRKLLTSSRGGLYTKMNVNGFLRADSDKRVAYYRGMRDMGALNVNEIRELEERDTIGPDGDAYNITVQYQAQAAKPATDDGNGDGNADATGRTRANGAHVT